MQKKLPYKIMLDRYSQKDLAKTTLKVGSIVIATIDETDTVYPQKEICKVVSIKNDILELVNLFEKDECYSVNKDKVIIPTELEPKLIWDRVALGNAQNEKDPKTWYKEFKWLLSDWKFVPGGRIMSMLGSKYQDNLTAFNCFVIDSPKDSRQGAIESLNIMTEILARGGGVGINLSTLRPRNSIVRGVNGTSSGAVSWGKGYSYYAGLIEQGGTRRGAILEGLEVWHPDIIEFITVKKNKGEMLNANLSVFITDEFMAALECGNDWSLEFPDTSHEKYNAEWDGSLRTWKSKGYPVVLYKTLPAQDLWNLIMESNWESAEPGVIFIDRMNRLSNSYYFEKIISTNPCLTGDTLVSTDEGLYRMKDLYDTQKSLKVTVDKRLSSCSITESSSVIKNGYKEVFKLITKEGLELRLTKDHKVLTKRGWVESKDLIKDDQIYVQNTDSYFGTSGSYEMGLCLGWLIGDGNFKEQSVDLKFCGKKTELSKYFIEAIEYLQSSVENNFIKPHTRLLMSGRDTIIGSRFLYKYFNRYGINCTRNKKVVPNILFRGTKECQSGFIKALFSADGHVESASNSRNAVVLTSVDKKLLQDVQRLLLNFGIYGIIYNGRSKERLAFLPNGKGGKSLYSCNEVYDIRISGEGIKKFYDNIGFLQSDKNERLHNIVKSYSRGPYTKSQYCTFIELIPDGEEDVYDIMVPGVNAFNANGIVVHNCGELPLPAWGVCNLGHVNLSIIELDSTQEWGINWQHLRKVINLGVRFLDNVINITHYFFEQNEFVQKSTRRIGMGTMGLAELLIKLRIRYGSEDCLQFIDALYSFIRDTAYDASVALSVEKGPFLQFDEKKYLNGEFIKTLPESLRNAIAGAGIRNVSILTQAPTGSTGTMCGTSTGIEPFYDWVYTRKGRLGTEIQYSRVIEEYQKKNSIKELDLNNLPNEFVTAKELNPEEHLLVMARIQQYTDNSISKTVNCPTEWTKEQVNQLYKMAYELGCKGLTIYRDKSRDTQILSSIEKPTAPQKLSWGETMKKPKDTIYRLIKFNTGCGRIKLMIGTSKSLNNRVIDIYAIVNSEGGCQLNIQGEAIAISKYLRLGGSVEQLLENSIKAGNCSSYQYKRGKGAKNLYGKSCFNGVVKAIVDFQNGTLPDSVDIEGPAYEGISKKKNDGDCPGCGEDLITESGCLICKNCGYSKCE